MDEYLKRQRLAAEQQLARAKPPPHPAQLMEASSTPATPTGTRRASSGSTGSSAHHLITSPAPHPSHQQAHPERGGSLERGYSPGAQRKSEGMTGARGRDFGSRSLPKGATSSLTYGLMLDRIQQKRQHRQLQKQAANAACNDGSVSDSNYASYAGPHPSWIQSPASTYVTSSSSTGLITHSIMF